MTHDETLIPADAEAAIEAYGLKKMREVLDKLIESVELGTLTEGQALQNGSVLPMCASTSAAYHGSLDAALALHEALLPGWIWGRQQNGAMWVANRPHTIRAPAPMEPARALLLAVLKAYRETRE